jgi:hypothetical protein
MNQHCVLVERCRLTAKNVLHMKQRCVLVERWLGKTGHERPESHVKRIKL